MRGKATAGARPSRRGGARSIATSGRQPGNQRAEEAPSIVPAFGSDGVRRPRERSWLPGTRAPHVWINGRSTVDVAEHVFALMVTHDETTWSKVANDTQRLLGVPVAVQPLPDTVTWQGAALVRPDGVVAWRTAEAPATAGLDTVVAQILGRDSAE